MKSNPCFECGNPSLHKHHVIPRSLGGKRTIWLCENCHGLIHGLDFKDHSILIKKGIEKARSEGKQIGAPPLDPKAKAKIRKLLLKGFSYRQIKKKVQCSHWVILNERMKLGLYKSNLERISESIDRRVKELLQKKETIRK